MILKKDIKIFPHKILAFTSSRIKIISNKLKCVSPFFITTNIINSFVSVMKLSSVFLAELTTTTREFGGPKTQWRLIDTNYKMDTPKPVTWGAISTTGLIFSLGMVMVKTANVNGDNYLQMLRDYAFPRLAEVADIIN